MKIRHCKSVILIILCIAFVFTTVSCAKIAQNQLAEENPPVTDNEPVTTPDPVPETAENKPCYHTNTCKSHCEPNIVIVKCKVD